jgi:mono/diheme cytochrome c family protein
MTDGVAPTELTLHPAFPHTSYADDAGDPLDLKAYLDTVKPVRNAHAARPALSYKLRFALGAGNGCSSARFVQARPAKSPSWNRGAYLVTGPGHCGECHTARNFLGATRHGHALAGTKQGPDGNRVPNITPHAEKGLGLWSDKDIVDFLKTGNLPYGETADYPMDEVITNNTSHWTDDDLKATAEYLLSLPKRETP